VKDRRNGSSAIPSQPKTSQPKTSLPKTSWDELNQRIVACLKCPRLTEHCRTVAQVKRRAYLDQDYWGKPLPNFGSKRYKLLVVGLAPGAHGANRTGRMFTGDRSGDWLYRALFRAGFASQEQASSLSDGLKLKQCAITNVCHCAPPQNKVTAEEVANCRGFLKTLLELSIPRVIVALGKLAWDQLVRLAKSENWIEGRQPKFQHAARVEINIANSKTAKTVTLLGSYHPSQQNTFTGRLTEKMLDDVFSTAKEIC